MDAIPDGTAKISVRTLAPNSVAYLTEGMHGQLGTLPCSPVVRVDYPAFDDVYSQPVLGDMPAPRFNKPLILTIPHSFKVGEESEVVLGAPHGALKWQPCNDNVFFDGSEMHIAIPCGCPFLSRRALFSRVL